MLQNAYFLATVGFDTAEIEPARNLQKLKFAKFWKMVPTAGASRPGTALGGGRLDAAEPLAAGGHRPERHEAAHEGVPADVEDRLRELQDVLRPRRSSPGRQLRLPPSEGALIITESGRLGLSEVGS